MKQVVRFAGALGLISAAWVLTSCENQPPPETPAPPSPPPTTTLHLNHAQPKLRTVDLWLGPHQITAEVALTRTEVATGMMFRQTMEEDEGMLFVFGTPHRASFYMKNTYVPLSLAYIDPEGNLLEIHDLKPLDENSVPAASDEVQFVLEMKQGWFERHGIREGAYVRTDQGTLQETFFGY